MFDNPPVVDVFEHVAGDLLLVGAASTVRVAHGVDVGVGVKPARVTSHAGAVTQRDLRPKGHVEWLPFSQRGQASLETKQ
jgi:hypothetical protein